MRNTITTLVLLIAVSALFEQRLDRQARKSVESLMESFENMEPEKANRINVLARTIYEKSRNEDTRAIQFVSTEGNHYDLQAAVWFRAGLLYRGMKWDNVFITQALEPETAWSISNFDSYGFLPDKTASADGGIVIDYGSGTWHIPLRTSAERNKEKVITVHLTSSDLEEDGWQGEALRTDEQHLATDVLYLSFRLSNLLQLE